MRSICLKEMQICRLDLNFSLVRLFPYMVLGVMECVIYVLMPFGIDDSAF